MHFKKISMMKLKESSDGYNEWNTSVPRLLRSKAQFLCSEIETNINTNLIKRGGEDEIGTIILKLRSQYI